MTYDPHGRDRPDILRKRDDSMSGALTGGIAVALLLLFGIAIFALSSGNRDIVATDQPRTERTTPAPVDHRPGWHAGRAWARSEHPKPETAGKSAAGWRRGEIRSSAAAVAKEPPTPGEALSLCDVAAI